MVCKEMLSLVFSSVWGNLTCQSKLGSLLVRAAWGDHHSLLLSREMSEKAKLKRVPQCSRRCEIPRIGVSEFNLNLCRPHCRWLAMETQIWIQQKSQFEAGKHPAHPVNSRKKNANILFLLLLRFQTNWALDTFPEDTNRKRIPKKDWELWSWFRHIRAGCQWGPAQRSAAHPAVSETAEEHAELWERAWQWQTSPLIPQPGEVRFPNGRAAERPRGPAAASAPRNLLRSAHPTETAALCSWEHAENSSPRLWKWRELRSLQLWHSTATPRTGGDAPRPPRLKWTFSFQTSAETPPALTQLQIFVSSLDFVKVTSGPLWPLRCTLVSWAFKQRGERAAHASIKHSLHLKMSNIKLPTGVSPLSPEASLFYKLHYYGAIKRFNDLNSTLELSQMLSLSKYQFYRLPTQTWEILFSIF